VGGVSDGPRATSFNPDPKAIRKYTRRACAVAGAEGAVLILVDGGEVHLGCTHSGAWLGKVLEKALNDWRASATEAERGQAPSTPVVVQARTIPALAALSALASKAGGVVLDTLGKPKGKP
jgi:hypothetical protein